MVSLALRVFPAWTASLALRAWLAPPVCLAVKVRLAVKARLVLPVCMALPVFLALQVLKASPLRLVQSDLQGRSSRQENFTAIICAGTRHCLHGPWEVKT
jgi:hypothetical protein